MAYEMVMPYHLHMPSYFLETFTEYPFLKTIKPIMEKQVKSKCANGPVITILA